MAMNKEDQPIVKDPVDAKQAHRGRPAFRVLIGALLLTAIVLIVLMVWLRTDDSIAPVGAIDHQPSVALHVT